MLIYNFQKEFLGIDEKDLKELGYTDLSSLRSEVTDFADLFVKTPGYIHNFKHVHWIDFIDCAEDGEIPKVIINANNRNFRANISITYAYFTDNPSSKAYFIHLNNLRVLSDNEVQNIHDDILERPTPTYQPEKTFIPQESPKTEKPEIKIPEVETPLEVPNTNEFEFSNDYNTETNEPKVQNIIETNDLAVKDPLDSNDVKLDVDIDFTQETEELPLEEQVHHIKTIHQKNKFNNGYIYDPAIASKELGLPLDLIEEFIEDFIAQADEFKPELLSALADGDIDNVKSLSHKLKGVAANLRIEDAFEVLATINTTSDLAVIKTNLDLFYKIMSKLSGEEIDEIIEVEDDEIQEDNKYIEPQAQDMILDFKDEEPIEDSSLVENQTPEIDLDFKDDDLILDFKDDEQQDVQEKELDILTENEQELVIDYSKSKIANEIGLDLDSFNELFGDYIDEANHLITMMHDANANENYSLLQEEALKLKGMSDNMRIHDFTDELKLLMKIHNTEEANKLLETVKDTVNKLSKLGA